MGSERERERERLTIAVPLQYCVVQGRGPGDCLGFISAATLSGAGKAVTEEARRRVASVVRVGKCIVNLW